MASPPLPEYQYTALPPHDIRMVTLHPGHLPTPSESVSIRASSILAPYTATSYVWESNERLHLIDAADTGIVNLEHTGGGEPRAVAVCPSRPTGTIRITKNLRNLLINIRPGSDETRIHTWVDSIYINQDEQKEKTEQVKLMGKIFTRAERRPSFTREKRTKSPGSHSRRFPSDCMRSPTSKDPETLKNWHILSAIQNAQNYHATDSRDKIFTLFEISSIPSPRPRDQLQILPKALHTKVAKAYIYHKPNKPLFFFSLIDQSYYAEDLPSYLPD
ncbi:hypothetical protein B0T14DRAFT_497596 [Immersiella caudata]|uniref:Heterokaryon incompatibility domain-containing protein n=1 Tax=Immersiella caudata TaxID=314043 RepID=A0AA39WJ40_9PEZI|nr:hypothetical protein B0T14DRAFT_497596 [Immersiella caudata]